MEHHAFYEDGTEAPFTLVIMIYETEEYVCRECEAILFPPEEKVQPPKLKRSNHPLYRKSFWDTRIGVCNFCRAVVGEIDGQRTKQCRMTHLHHVSYDIKNPLAHTIELCPTCHAKELKKPFR